MKYKRVIWFIGSLLLMPYIAYGQPGQPGDGPIGGLIYLLIAGLGFGVYSLRNKKN